MNMSADELVDVIDENNTVLYQRTKKQAHEEGLLHRTVIAEVHTSNGEWVLVKQAGHKQDAGQYVSPVGGHVKAGETEIEALKRETEEEIGLTDFSYEKIGQFVYDRETLGHRENHLFVIFLIHSDEEFSLNDESVGYERFTEAELKEKLKAHPEQFGDAFHIIIKKLYTELQ